MIDKFKTNTSDNEKCVYECGGKRIKDLGRDWETSFSVVSWNSTEMTLNQDLSTYKEQGECSTPR